MGIQEGQDLPAGHAGPQQPCRDQPFPLLLPHDSHDLELLHVAIQLVLQIVWGGGGKEQLAPSERGDAGSCAPPAQPAAPIPFLPLTGAPAQTPHPRLDPAVGSGRHGASFPPKIKRVFG